MTDHTPGDELSEDARRAAFREELRLTPESGGGRIVGRIPKRILWGAVAAMAVLGIGGQFVEHYFGNIGLPSSTGPTTTFTSPTTIPSFTTTTVVSPAAADAAFIGLKGIASAQAPVINLTDQTGHPYGTGPATGKVTLVTFFNKNCNDICPVLGRELKDFLDRLGPQASRVNVIIVNTDPFSYGLSTSPQALVATGLAAYPQVHFVTGPVATLNPIWNAYGVEVKVGATAAQVAHNSVIYFVTTTSQLAAIAVPFAQVNAQGRFSLRPDYITRFAEGLRYETISLIQ